MKRKIPLSFLQSSVVLLFTLIAMGCDSKSDTTTPTLDAGDRKSAESQDLDFDALLTALDAAIGERFQAVQMNGMNSVTYEYDGPIKTVEDIVEPMALEAGFTEMKNGAATGMGAAQMQQTGIKMNSMNQKMYTHPNGDTLTFSAVDMSTDDLDMKMLTIQLMNMSAFTPQEP